MTFSQRMVLWVILTAVAFGAGFWIGYDRLRSVRAEMRETQTELTAAQGRIHDLEYQARLAQIRHLAALMYFETHRQNYEIASNHSTRYFNELRRAADAPDHPTIQNALEELLSTRDTITAELARGSPTALNYVQSLFLKTHQVTTRNEQSDTSR